MLSVKPADRLTHYYRKKNVCRYYYVVIVVRVTSYRVSRQVFKLKSANVQQHERKRPKTKVSFFLFFASLGYFSLCCLGFDQYTFYFNKTKHGKEILFERRQFRSSDCRCTSVENSLPISYLSMGKIPAFSLV